jgi:hypothetical protein
MSDRGEQLIGSSANRATLCELIAQREAENAKLELIANNAAHGRNLGISEICDLQDENAKLREYKDKDLESHKLRVVMKENAKLRVIMQELVDDYSVGPIERTKIQAALK